MTSNRMALQELAKRGLEISNQIDEMIQGLWKRLQKIDPDLAAWAENKFGSSEMAAFFMMGRIHDHPSLLETLATEGPDTVKALLLLEFDPAYPGFGTNVQHEKAAESLSTQADRKRKDYESDLVDIFKQLRAQDPEVADRALHLWDDLLDAAEFMATPSKINGISPLQMIEEGKRQAVLTLIGQIEFGLPT